MKTQLIASAIALIAFANVGTAQQVAKPKKVNPAKPAFHRAPPPPPAIVEPVLLQETNVNRLPPAPAVPPVESISAIEEVVTPPPPPPPPTAKVTKITIKDAPPAPSKKKLVGKQAVD